MLDICFHPDTIMSSSAIVIKRTDFGWEKGAKMVKE